MSEEVTIRDAGPEDAAFVAWVVLSAHRSHLPKGYWDHVLSDDEAVVLSTLEKLAVTEAPHFAHVSAFQIAEVDRTPAAGMCGYFEEELTMEKLVEATRAAIAAQGIAYEEIVQRFPAANTIANVAPDHEPGTWIVEHVATRPEFRRRGLVDQLLRATLDRGRERGASRADIGILMGNDRAQSAYEKAGFAVSQELHDPDFEAVYGCPGIRELSREL